MARFIHADHCLCDVGGHEYDYAKNMLQAGEAAGFEVGLATNQRFQDNSLYSRHLPIYPVFPNTAYTKHCAWYGGKRHQPIGLAGETLTLPVEDRRRDSRLRSLGSRISRIAGICRQRQRGQMIHDFSAACRQLFERVRLDEDDHVFFATITEFDLLGLAKFFQDHLREPIGNWHLQFHFGLYGGCAPEAPARAVRHQAMRRQFEFITQILQRQNVFFYTTTQQLAAQYNELEVAHFRHIPFAVSTAMHARDKLSHGPLRVTTAGAARRDKKPQDLRHIVQAIRNDAFFNRKIEIAAQLSERRRRGLRISDQSMETDPAKIPFCAVPHPLERDEYQQLVHGTDIGLFLHDRRRYAAQCSGVLHEMLAAGKPVIVPGGCWLASQIAEPNFAHIESLCQTLRTVDSQTSTQLHWQAPSGESGRKHGNGINLKPKELAQTCLTVPPGATDLVVEFHWPAAASQGQFAGIHVKTISPQGYQHTQQRCVVGWRDGRPSFSIFRLDADAHQVMLQLQNSYEFERIMLREMQVRFLSSRDPLRHPAGSVGLTASHPDQIPRLLREMVQHYDHYRESAIAFSRNWCETHHPSQTIAILTCGQHGKLRAA